MAGSYEGDWQQPMAEPQGEAAFVIQPSQQVAQQRRRRRRPDLLEGESVDLGEEAGGFLDNADAWMDAPNAKLGGLSPNQAIANGDEELVRNILRQARFVGVS